MDEHDHVRGKIDQICQQGEEALRTGKVKLFQGFPESLKLRAGAFLVSGCLSSKIKSLILSIEEKAREQGLKPFTADIDFPLHTTLLEAEKVDATGGEEILVRKEEVIVSGKVAGLDLAGGAIFSDVVVDASLNVLLVASKIPPWVLAARTEVGRRYLEAGFIPRPLDNLFHITVQRIHACDYSTEAIQAYAEAINTLAQATGELFIPFTQLYRGSSGEFLAETV